MKNNKKFLIVFLAIIIIPTLTFPLVTFQALQIYEEPQIVNLQIKLKITEQNITHPVNVTFCKPDSKGVFDFKNGNNLRELINTSQISFSINSSKGAEMIVVISDDTLDPWYYTTAYHFELTPNSKIIEANVWTLDRHGSMLDKLGNINYKFTFSPSSKYIVSNLTQTHDNVWSLGNVELWPRFSEKNFKIQE